MVMSLCVPTGPRGKHPFDVQFPPPFRALLTLCYYFRDLEARTFTLAGFSYERIGKRWGTAVANNPDASDSRLVAITTEYRKLRVSPRGPETTHQHEL